jgi:hypothetical protein
MRFAALPTPLYDKGLFGWIFFPFHKLLFNLSFQHFHLSATFSRDFLHKNRFFKATFQEIMDFF